MSAFAALQGEDGDATEMRDKIVVAKKKQIAVEKAQQEAEAAASRVAFEDLRSKTGSSNWADEDDDDFFNSLPVCSFL